MLSAKSQNGFVTCWKDLSAFSSPRPRRYFSILTLSTGSFVPVRFRRGLQLLSTLFSSFHYRLDLFVVYPQLLVTTDFYRSTNIRCSARNITVPVVSYHAVLGGDKRFLARTIRRDDGQTLRISLSLLPLLPATSPLHVSGDKTSC